MHPGSPPPLSLEPDVDHGRIAADPMAKVVDLDVDRRLYVRAGCKAHTKLGLLTVSALSVFRQQLLDICLYVVLVHYARPITRCHAALLINQESIGHTLNAV